MQLGLTPGRIYHIHLRKRSNVCIQDGWGWAVQMCVYGDASRTVAVLGPDEERSQLGRALPHQTRRVDVELHLWTGARGWWELEGQGETFTLNSTMRGH